MFNQVDFVLQHCLSKDQQPFRRRYIENLEKLRGGGPTQPPEAAGAFEQWRTIGIWGSVQNMMKLLCLIC